MSVKLVNFKSLRLVCFRSLMLVSGYLDHFFRSLRLVSFSSLRLVHFGSLRLVSLCPVGGQLETELCSRIVLFCGQVVTTGLLERCVTAFPWIHYVNLYSVSEAHDITYCDLTEWYQQEKVGHNLSVSWYQFFSNYPLILYLTYFANKTIYHIL